MYKPLLIPNDTETIVGNAEDFFSVGAAIPVGNIESELIKFVATLPEDSCAPFTTQGRITSAKLLSMLLDKTGPADVFITSWSITMGAVQQMVNLLLKTKIRDLKIVLDSRAPKHWPDAFQLLSMNVPQLRLAKCHAKLIAVRNDNHTVVVVSSLNWSEQHSRFEAGFITTNATHVNKVIADIENLYSKANAWR